MTTYARRIYPEAFPLSSSSRDQNEEPTGSSNVGASASNKNAGRSGASTGFTRELFRRAGTAAKSELADSSAISSKSDGFMDSSAPLKPWNERRPALRETAFDDDKDSGLASGSRDSCASATSVDALSFWASSSCPSRKCSSETSGSYHGLSSSGSTTSGYCDSPTTSDDE